MLLLIKYLQFMKITRSVTKNEGFAQSYHVLFASFNVQFSIFQARIVFEHLWAIFVVVKSMVSKEYTFLTND